MDLDVERLLDAVERAVWSLEHDGQAARAVTLARSYATTVEDLWDAVTSRGPGRASGGRLRGVRAAQAARLGRDDLRCAASGAVKYLIDECPSPSLAALARERGFPDRCDSAASCPGRGGGGRCRAP